MLNACVIIMERNLTFSQFIVVAFSFSEMRIAGAMSQNVGGRGRGWGYLRVPCCNTILPESCYDSSFRMPFGPNGL